MAKEPYEFPKHIAIIMDGNGRWATKRGLPRLEGHRAGFRTVRDIVRYLGETGHIKYATFYAFSTENWQRPQAEVNGIFQLLNNSIKNEAMELNKNNVRIRWLGQTSSLSNKLIRDIRDAVELTANNTGITISLALNYGGRQEITDAVRQIVAENITPEDVNEETINDHLYTAGMPDVDLLIRTADELRISNFLLWQVAYAEFYFTPVLWPDFNRDELDKALQAFSMRQRRFGRL
ncbi:MAG: isoprenyl transferase [Dehalococcoidia bacterium]|nr:isoprenyl transferase [Dehalococcoidia bacterium]